MIAWCNALATLHPNDPELISARARLRQHGFVPPAPRELPAGTPAEVRARLARRNPAELAALASAMVTLPDPDAEPQRAAAALELMLVVPGEDARAGRLLASFEARSGPDGGIDATVVALWRFRLGAGGLDAAARVDAERWEALLAPIRAIPVAGSEALRLAASGWLAAAARDAEPGAAWLVPVLDGRHVVNAWLARRRRPALGAPEALGPAFAWLDEAARASGAGGPAEDDRPGPEALVAAADRADRAGDADLGTRLLLEAAGAATDDRLDAAVAARAALLVDPSLGAAAAASQTGLAHRVVPAPAASAPSPPRRDWTHRLLALAVAPARDDADLGLVEAAGARERAARAWFARGDLAGLLQAARLRDHLTPSERCALADALAAVESDDEVQLAADPAARDAAIARWWLLPNGLERRLLRARLAALLFNAPAAVALPDEDDDDPHSVANRLAAAADLLEAGRLDAAVAVLTALLRKVEAGSQLGRLGALCARALEHDPPPVDLAEAVEKRLRAADAAADALLAALAANPTGAYALHETLLALGSDVSRPDAYRVTALTAWLAIWSATRTPPSDDAIAPIARADAGLLPLAAARIAGATDPIRVALDHLARHPPGADDAAARADDLLALALGTPA